MAAGLPQSPRGIQALDLHHGLYLSAEFESVLRADGVDCSREVDGGDLAGPSEEHELFGRIRELPDVARPAVSAELAHRFGRKAAYLRLRVLCAALGQEVLQQRRDVISMVAQGG